MLQLTPPSDLSVLYHSGAYVPLSMFTQCNLSTLQLMGTAGKTHKTQMSVPTYKKTVSVRVINIHDPRFTKETALSYEDWRSAGITMISWAMTLHSDSVYVDWLRAHFDWCDQRIITARTAFSLVLTFDIEMRLSYHRQPFSFQPAWHLEKFNEIRTQMHLLGLPPVAAPLATLTHGSGLLTSEFYGHARSVASSSRPPQGSSGSGQSSQPNARPFQKGQSGEPRSAGSQLGATGPNSSRNGTQPSKDSLLSAATTPSVPDGTPVVVPPPAALPIPTVPSTPVPTAVRENTMPSLGPACPPPRFDAGRSPITGELLPVPLPDHITSTHPEILNRICTPYDADAFDAILDEHPQLRTESPHLTEKLRHGFPMGVFLDLEETVIFPNNKSIEQHMDFVDEYFKEEVESGRMSGPYSQEELEGILGGAFQCSPLSIDEKEVDGSFETKLRMCINLSKGTDEHPSVNSFSDKDDFPTNYDPATYVADLVANAPPGTKAMVMDISKFHRRTPICPAHKKCNSGQISKVVLKTWSVRGIKPNGKWSDDVFAFVSPSSGSGTSDDPYLYPYDEDDVLQAVASTKTPWHPLSKKGQPFRPIFDYVGMVWDLDAKTVAVKEEKRTRFLFRADVFRANVCTQRVTEQEVMEVHGSLCHIAFVHRQGRSRLASLSAFIAEFHQYRPGKPLFAKKSVIDDIEWWVDALRIPHFSRPLVPLGDVQDLGISVDASTDWGIGLQWGNNWDAWRVKDGWKGPWRDIGWLECLAIELLVLRLEERGFHDCRIRVLSDNQGIIGAFWKGRSRNVQVNFSIRRFMAILDSLHISLEVEYVKSEDNPADPVSRGIVGPSSRQLTPVVPLPAELESYLLHHHA
ncbi:hypothetical protein NMY22_g883 [Coprinellus aureogranulatus]|nr:hypothetical protein NMY22_g883 [Coprinellus aureogranulatus]